MEEVPRFANIGADLGHHENDVFGEVELIVAIDKAREVIAGVGVSAGLVSLWLAIVMHSFSALFGGTVVGMVAAFAIAAVSRTPGK